MPSKPVTLTYGDTLQPVLLRQLNDKWSCLSANICYSSAAWTGTARPAPRRLLAWQPPLKPASTSSVTQLQPISNRTLLSELLQPQSHPILVVFALLQPVFIIGRLSLINWTEKQVDIARKFECRVAFVYLNILLNISCISSIWCCAPFGPQEYTVN